MNARTQWLNNTRGCPPPEDFLLPFGSGIRVKEGGIRVAEALWTPQIGYIVPDNVARLEKVSSHMDGFTIQTGDVYHGTPRVDTVHPGGESTTRFYGEGMVEVYCIVTDFKKALTSMKTNPVLTCCPVCVDPERYLNDDMYRELYDTCSKYFLRYWYYGSI